MRDDFIRGHVDEYLHQKPQDVRHPVQLVAVTPISPLPHPHKGSVRRPQLAAGGLRALTEGCTAFHEEALTSPRPPLPFPYHQQTRAHTHSPPPSHKGEGWGQAGHGAPRAPRYGAAAPVQGLFAIPIPIPIPILIPVPTCGSRPRCSSRARPAAPSPAAAARPPCARGAGPGSAAAMATAGGAGPPPEGGIWGEKPLFGVPSRA